MDRLLGAGSALNSWVYAIASRFSLSGTNGDALSGESAYESRGLAALCGVGDR